MLRILNTSSGAPTSTLRCTGQRSWRPGMPLGRPWLRWTFIYNLKQTAYFTWFLEQMFRITRRKPWLSCTIYLVSSTQLKNWINKICLNKNGLYSFCFYGQSSISSLWFYATSSLDRHNYLGRSIVSDTILPRNIDLKNWPQISLNISIPPLFKWCQELRISRYVFYLKLLAIERKQVC